MARKQTVDYFLEAYKAYETALREHGKEYKDAEEMAPPTRQGRMRIVRQMRNYLTHAEDPGFLATTMEQVAFLESLAKEERLCGDILRNHLHTPARGALEEHCPLRQAVEKLARGKHSYMPVYNRDGILGAVEIHRVLSLYLKYPDGLLNKKSYGPYEKIVLCREPDTQMTDIPETSLPRVICCTGDGYPSGKFLGVMKE